MKKAKWKVTLIETEAYEKQNLVIPLLAERQNHPDIDKDDPRIRTVQTNVKGWDDNVCIIEIEPHQYALVQ